MIAPRLLFVLQIAAVAAIVACLVLLASRFPLRVDLTPDKRFTLTSHTRGVLARLDRDARITYFFSSQDAVIRRNAAAVLRLYEDASPNLSVRLLDLDRNPGVAERYGVASYNVAVLESGELRLRLDLVNEQVLTAALLRAVDREPIVAYVVQGHGERPLSGDLRRGLSQALGSLASEGVTPRVLEGVAEIPPDAGMVVLAGPSEDLAQAEVDALDHWVRGGGQLVVLGEAPTPARLAELLGRYGIVPSDDLVVDVQGRLLGTDGLSARVAYVNQAIIPTVPEANALLPVAQTVLLDDAPGVESDYLAVTAENAWADVDRGAMGGTLPVAPGPEDRKGPLPIAALATMSGTAGPGGRVLFVGDADFATNLHVDVLGNRELFLALMGLVAHKPTTFAERATSQPPSPLSAFIVTTTESRLLLLLGSVGPALLLSLIAFFAHRRSLA